MWGSNSSGVPKVRALVPASDLRLLLESEIHGGAVAAVGASGGDPSPCARARGLCASHRFSKLRLALASAGWAHVQKCMWPVGCCSPPCLLHCKCDSLQYQALWTVGACFVRSAHAAVPCRPVWVETWLILPVVICLSQRLSHACLSVNFYMVKLRMAH